MKEPRLSFFDEADEPLTEPQRRRPSGGGRRPPGGHERSQSEQQQILVRRVIAGTVLLAVVIVIALGIHGCEVSQRNSDLKSYATSVASLIARSKQTTASALFGALSRGGGAVAIRNSVASALTDADSDLATAQKLSPPAEMSTAQSHLVFAMQMRTNAIKDIANNVESALSKAGGQAVQTIAADMGALYASDVVYKDYVAPEIAAVLNGVGITPNGANGAPISNQQFVGNISWLTPSYVASTIGSSAATSSSAGTGSACTSKSCGDSMTSVSVAGTTLTPGGTATLPAHPPPTFTCTFTNDGQQPLTGTIVRVSVEGTGISGQVTQAQTQPGGSYTAQVALSSSPPAGTHTVTATVEGHPGESPLTHNTQTFTITFR